MWQGSIGDMSLDIRSVRSVVSPEDFVVIWLLPSYSDCERVVVPHPVRWFNGLQHTKRAPFIYGVLRYIPPPLEHVRRGPIVAKVTDAIINAAFNSRSRSCFKPPVCHSVWGNRRKTLVVNVMIVIHKRSRSSIATEVCSMDIVVVHVGSM